MAEYIYRAVNKNGEIVENQVEGLNRYTVMKKLKDNKFLPISVTSVVAKRKKDRKKRNVEANDSILKEVRAQEVLKRKDETVTEKINKMLNRNSKVKIRDVVTFTQNLYLLKKANFNNIHALSTIIESTEHPTLKAAIEDILVGVETGENMYVTMEYYEDIFPAIYMNMIKVGELSGSLVRALEQAIKYLDETAELTRKIRRILVPNVIQFVVLTILLVVGTLIAIPAIQNVFEQVGSTEQLPAITLWFKGLLDTLITYWYIPTAILLGIVVGIRVYVSSPQGKYNYHHFKYRMPVFGELIYAVDFSRLIKALLLNVRNGMRIQESLETSKNATGNLVMLSLIESSINNIVAGQSWIEPFERAGLSSPMVTEMLKIGMQTDIAEMMEKLVEYMEIDIENIMQRIMKVMPQIVYVIVGVQLLFVTIVVLVPLIQVYMGTWLFSAYL